MNLDIKARFFFDRLVGQHRGELFDVSSLMSFFDLKADVLITKKVWDRYVSLDPSDFVLGDILWMLRCHLTGLLPCSRLDHPYGCVLEFELLACVKGQADPSLIRLQALVDDRTGWVTVYEHGDRIPGKEIRPN